MEKKGSITVFLALILSILLSLVSAGSSDKNSDSEWNGYRTVLFVWAV